MYPTRPAKFSLISLMVSVRLKLRLRLLLWVLRPWPWNGRAAAKGATTNRRYPSMVLKGAIETVL